jgi:hypothetical protein
VSRPGSPRRRSRLPWNPTVAYSRLHWHPPSPPGPSSPVWVPMYWRGTLSTRPVHNRQLLATSAHEAPPTRFSRVLRGRTQQYSHKGVSEVLRSRIAFLKQASVRCCSLVEKAWPRPNASALLARVPRIGAYQASFPRPITCGAGFPSGAAGSSGPCVPIAFALGPLAVHRLLYHPKSARCFAPFTTPTGHMCARRTAERLWWCALNSLARSPL